MDITAWLRGLGLGQYEQVFRANAIGADVLQALTDEHLKELGLPLGHRLKLLNAIAALRTRAAEQGPTEPIPPAPSPAMQGERRQVTVLFADLAGYTALSRELDAEEVHALLERFFDRVDRIVEEHGGHVDKHIGDCVMAVFGAPVAHGNDAERAVRAALAIRDAMPELSARGRAVRLRVHIGVAGGQVVASGTGSASHREYTVTGDTVNLASRLTDAAAAGEILVSEKVRRALGRAARLRRGGGARGQGLRRAGAGLAAARPAAAAAPASRPPLRRPAERAAPVHGGAGGLPRDGPRARRSTSAARPASARRAWSRSSSDAAREAGFACHTGLVLDFGTGTGRDAIRALVRSLLGLDARERCGSRPRAAAERALADGLVAADDAVFLNDLLDLPQPAELRALYDAMDNATRNQGKRRTVARLVERASRARAAPSGHRGRALGGPADAGASGQAGGHGGGVPRAPGHDLADRGRSARPGVAEPDRRRSRS